MRFIGVILSYDLEQPRKYIPSTGGVKNEGVFHHRFCISLYECPSGTMGHANTRFATSGVLRAAGRWRAAGRRGRGAAKRSGGETLHGWSWKTKEEGTDPTSRKPVEKARMSLDSRFPHLKLWKKWITWNSLVPIGGNPSRKHLSSAFNQSNIHALPAPFHDLSFTQASDLGF